MRNLIHTLFAFLLIFVCASANAQTGKPRITVTIAGTGTQGFNGDLASGTTAQINSPKDLCMDAAQNIYFVDHMNGRIRKVSAQNGVITTYAGGGSSTADGVSKLSAQFDPISTSYMCINPTGDIFICTANKIRKISASGIVTTIAGTGTPGFSGDGGPATAAMLNNPQGICIDAAGNLYIVDRNNDRIRKITASTGTITTIAGGGASTADGVAATSQSLNRPACICITSTGSIFFSDRNVNFPTGYCDSRIRKIDPAGIITTVAGLNPSFGTANVPANTAFIGTITGLCCDDSDDVYCDEMSCACRKLTKAMDTLWIVGGDFAIQGYSDDMAGPMSNMNNPHGLCVDHSGNVYIADSGNHRVRKIIPVTNKPTFALGKGQHINPLSAAIYSLDAVLKITDADLSQMETWTVVSGPTHGALTGFPATKASEGVNATTKPAGVYYSSTALYNGQDSFKVKVSDGTQTDIITIYVWVGTNLPTAANELAVNNSVNIFPNPVSSVLNIQWTDGGDNTGIALTDVAGHVIYHAALTDKNGTLQVDVTDLAPGVYHTNVNGQAGTFVKQ